MNPDSLLPFAIAAILGFLVLGLNGGGKHDSEKVHGPSQSVESISEYKAKAVRSSEDLRVQMNSPPSPPKH